MIKISQKYRPGILWAAVILVLTGAPGNFFPSYTSFWDWIGPDKIAHLFMFGILSFVILWGYRDKYRNATRKTSIFMLLIAFLITSAYGGLTEYLQNTIFINRSGNRFDFYADTIGGLLGIVIYTFLFRKNRT